MRNPNADQFREAVRQSRVGCGRSVRIKSGSDVEPVQVPDHGGMRTVGAWVDVQIYVAASEAMGERSIRFEKPPTEGEA